MTQKTVDLIIHVWVMASQYPEGKVHKKCDGIEKSEAFILSKKSQFKVAVEMYSGAKLVTRWLKNAISASQWFDR